jgi:hypothetical protein
MMNHYIQRAINLIRPAYAKVLDVTVTFNDRVIKNLDAVNIGKTTAKLKQSIAFVITSSEDMIVDASAIGIEVEGLPSRVNVTSSGIELKIPFTPGYGIQQFCIKLSTPCRQFIARIQYEGIQKDIALDFVTDKIYHSGAIIQLPEDPSVNLIVGNSDKNFEVNVVGFRLSNPSYVIRNYKKLPFSINPNDAVSFGIISLGNGNCDLEIMTQASPSRVTLTR